MGDGREYLSTDSFVGGELIGYKLPRHFALMFQCLAKETFSGSTIPPTCDQDVNYISALICCSPQIVTLASDRDEEFINVPDIAQTALFLAELSSVLGSELLAPVSNRLIREGDSAFGQ
jgi:hypothetical protein